MKIEWEKVTHTEGICSDYKDVPVGATILAVDDVESVGTCEACGLPILEGELYGSAEDVDIHLKCLGEE